MSLVDYATARQPVAAKRRILPFSPGLWLAVLVMLLAVLAALFPALFTQASPIEGIAGAQRLAPQAGHWLGTDQLGRDLFARIVYGASHSLSAAVMAVAIGLLAGTALGLVAGAIGGKTESIVMRAVDVLLAIPALLLSLSVLILLGFGTLNAALAVGIASIASFARLACAEVVRIRHSEYVEAAYGSGGRFFSVLWRHILRNAMLPVLTVAGLLLGELIAGALITETVFGLGGLGQLTQQAVNNQDVAVLQAVVMISALGFVVINLLVDLLMPLFDPRLQLLRGAT